MTTVSAERSVAAMAWPIALLVLMLVFGPVIDVAAAIGSFQPGVLQWRFGVVGLMSGSLITPVLGVVIAAVAAHSLERRTLLRSVSVVAIVASLGILATMFLFVLDALQLRATVRSELMQPWMIATVKALIGQSFAFSVLAAVGVTGWKASRRVRTATAVTQGGDSVLVSGTGSKATRATDARTEPDMLLGSRP